MHIYIQSDMKDTWVEKLIFLCQTLGPLEASFQKRLQSKDEIEAISLLKGEVEYPEGDEGKEQERIHQTNEDKYLDYIYVVHYAL